MTDEQTKRVIRLWAESGQIERYKPPLVSENFKSLASGILIGFFCGFIWGVLVVKVWMP